MITYEAATSTEAAVKRPFAMARSVTQRRLIHRVADTGHRLWWSAELATVTRTRPARKNRRAVEYVDWIRTGKMELSRLSVKLVCKQPSYLTNPILLTHGEVADRLSLPEYTQCKQCFQGGSA